MANTRKNAQAATTDAQVRTLEENGINPEAKAGIAVARTDARLAGTEVDFARMPIGLCSAKLVDFDRIETRIFNKGKANEYVDPEHFALKFELYGTDWTITQNVYWWDKERRNKWLQRLDNASGNKTRKLQTLPEILEYLMNNWTGAQIKEFWNKQQRKNIIFLDWDISGAEEKKSSRK